jgi:hypothetical protein
MYDHFWCISMCFPAVFDSQQSFGAPLIQEKGGLMLLCELTSNDLEYCMSEPPRFLADVGWWWMMPLK